MPPSVYRGQEAPSVQKKKQLSLVKYIQMYKKSKPLAKKNDHGMHTKAWQISVAMQRQYFRSFKINHL